MTGQRAILTLGLGAAVAGVLAISLRGRRPESQVPGRLGRWFTWTELTASRTARRLRLDNTSPPEAQRAMRALVAEVLDPLRDRLGRPVRITSGYRSPAVNKAVGGVPDSQHVRGEAVDLVVDGLTPHQIAAVIVESGLPFDQLIAYAPGRGGHLHLSFVVGWPNRREMLSAPAGGGSRGFAQPT